MPKSAFLVLALLNVAILHSATTWHVAVTGHDGPACGTASSPCKSIQYTINRAVSGDSISIAAGTYPEHLTIPINLTLSGAGPAATILDGSNSGTVVRVAASKSVVLARLTVQHGRTIQCGGGIFNAGSLTLLRVAVSDNRAINPDPFPGQGAGICNYGNLIAIASTISDNKAVESGGIHNVGSMCLMLASTLSGNHSDSFGGAAESFGPLHLVNSTVSGNDAIYGGGLYNVGTLVVNSSTLSGNSATLGGGIFNEISAAPFVLKNSILAGNTAFSAPDCENSLISQDYNLIGDSANCSIIGGHTTSWGCLRTWALCRTTGDPLLRWRYFPAAQPSTARTLPAARPPAASRL